jgi:hypothetical protein
LSLDAATLASMTDVAKAMSQARATIPKHLQGSPGDCLAVIFQAQQWGMNPFAVAQKTHIVNGSLGYEAQLVIAVVNSSPLLATRLAFSLEGEWKSVNGKSDKDASRACTVYATLRGESEPRKIRVSMAQVGDVRNSPLWVSDPAQQLAYLAAKKWSRLHAPDVMLGVYGVDDPIDDNPVVAWAAPITDPAPDPVVPPTPPADPTQAEGRKHLGALFSTLGWDRQTQQEWLDSNFPDRGRTPDVETLAAMAAKLEPLLAMKPAIDVPVDAPEDPAGQVFSPDPEQTAPTVGTDEVPF